MCCWVCPQGNLRGCVYTSCAATPKVKPTSWTLRREPSSKPTVHTEGRAQFVVLAEKWNSFSWGSAKGQSCFLQWAVPAGLVVFSAAAQLSSFASIGNIRWQQSLSSNCLIHCFEVTPQQRTNTPSSLTCVCTTAPKHHVQAESELDSCLGWMLNKCLWRNRFCAFSPEECARWEICRVWKDLKITLF